MKRLSVHECACVLCLFALTMACDAAPSTNVSDMGVSDAFQNQDTLVDTRRDEARDAAPDTDSGAEDLSDIWDNVTNRCAQTHAPPPPSRWGEEQERPEQVVASLAWGRKSPCEGMRSPQGIDQVGDRGSMVLAKRDGEDVVAVTHELTSAPDWSGNGVKALAWLEPTDGTPLECDVYPDGRGVVFTPIHPTPWSPENVIAPTTTNQNGFTSELVNDSPTTTWWSPDWPPGDDKMLPDPANESGFITPQTKLLPDGQLLLFPRSDRFASVDVLTGELNWVVRPGDIRALIKDKLGEEYQGPILLRRQSTRFDKNRRVVRARLVVASAALAKSLYLEVDSCGAISLTEVSPPEDVMWEDIPFGDGVLEVGLDGETYKARVRDEDQTIGTLTECLQLVTLASDTVGCMRRSKFGAAFELEKLTWPARKSVVRLDESHSQEAEIVLFYDTTVALTGGVLMLYATYSSALEGTHRLIFLDWRSGEVLTHVEYTTPPDAVVNEIPGPALVTSDGTVIVQHGGYLQGISTNTGGLAPTHFPRGVDLGRNDNLGIWNP